MKQTLAFFLLIPSSLLCSRLLKQKICLGSALNSVITEDWVALKLAYSKGGQPTLSRQLTL